VPEQQQGKHWTETRKSVPAEALRFDVGAFEFAGAEKATADGKRPVRLLGRTGKPIAHWYWGTVVHDMAGMKLHKERLPIDYEHYEPIGYLDKFDTTSGDLVATGELVPFTKDDRAAEVIFKSDQGVPYEASINFAGGAMRLEEIEPGASTTVNGTQVNGPALVIREWTLRGIAVCLYGQDMGTKTELSAKAQAGQLPTIEVSLFKEATHMTTTNTTAGQGDKGNGNKTDGTSTPPAGSTELQQQPAAAGTPAPTPAAPASAETDVTKLTAKHYGDAFGDVGYRWHAEGKTFAVAAAEFIAGQKTSIDALTKEVGELKQRIADMPAGNDPATFQAEKKDENPRTAEFQQKLGNNLGKFAASLKLPGRGTAATASTAAKK
jgi:hypothetical protein